MKSLPKTFCNTARLAALAAVMLGSWLQTAAQAAVPAISYVQGSYSTPQSPQTTVNVTFTAAQVAGDLNVVVVGWNDSTATVTRGRRQERQHVHARRGTHDRCRRVVAVDLLRQEHRGRRRGSQCGHSDFLEGGGVSADIRILEYSGADPNNPVDVTFR